VEEGDQGPLAVFGYFCRSWSS